LKKRILSVLLAVLMLVGMIPMPLANAASTLEEAMADVSIYAKDATLNYLTMNGSVKEQHYTYYRYQSVQTGETKEIPAYCVDPRLYGVPGTVPEGTPIHYSAESTVNDPKICGIISNGYPHLTLDDLGLQSVDEAYYATKTAVWIYLLGDWTISGLGVNPNLTGADKAAAQRVLTATKAIYQRGMYWDELVSPRMTSTPDQSTAYLTTINGTEFYQQVFTINSDTWALTPVLLSLDEGAPAGTKIMSMDNDEISQIKLATTRTPGAGYQAQVKVVYPKSAVEGESGTCQLIMNATVVEYKLFYASTLEADRYGRLQNYILDTDPSTPATATAISSFSSNPPPPPPDEPDPEPEESTLKIIKLEEGTEKPLSGAIFDVWYPSGEKYGSFSTGADGTITLPINVFGNYTVTERVPPQYHILPEISTQHVTVTALTGGVLTFWNAPYGNLRVHKISDTGDNLEGVSITIKCLKTGETRTGQTGPGGVIEFTELKPGGYEVRETAGIEGYVVDVEATRTATVVTGQTSDVTFINKEKPGLRIIKYDRKTLQTMSDISFEIWKDGTSIGIHKTDAMGEIVLPNLEPGTYLIKEVQTDNGHIADPTPQQIELHAGDGIRQVLFYNDQKPGIHLVKVDSSDLSKVIPNVKFRFEAVDGSYGPAEFTTDANGEIDLSELPTGAYVVTELECPGYVIDNASRIIELVANQTAQFVFTNTKKPSIEIVKYDPQTGKYLAGATFRIARIEDGSHYLDRVTDTQGRIRIDDLEPGIYSVQEMSAPSGYILDPTEYHVELFPGKTSELVVNNEKKPDLRIIKTDAITGRPVAGATFTIRMVDSSTLITETTDANGEILLREMDPGVYEITEQSVPDGYLLDPIPQQITLVPNKLGVVQFQNYPKPTLTIRKIDSATGKPVEGARFHIIYASNHTFTGEVNDLGEYYSDADGIIRLDKLRDGWYRIEEVEAPAGYRIKDNGVQECYIAAGRDKVLTFENIPLSTVLIRKMDEETGEPLAGAWFRMTYLNEMTSMDGTTIGEWPTDQDGQIEVTGLDEGTYIISELSAPAGYVLDPTNTRTVYLSGENQDYVSITFGNQKMGSLLITKKDSLTGAPLSGVEFFVTDSDGAVIGNANGKFVTDFAGSILINNLKPGSTIVARESRTISGYVLDDAPQTIKIRANETVSLEFRNAPKGTLIVQKIDASTGEPLTGAQFKIVAANGELTADNEGLTSSNGLYTVDRNGQIVLEKLTPGTYIVTEQLAPDGFILDRQPQTVVVNAGDTQTLTFANAPKGSLVIEKYDKVTNERLPGAQFRITTASGELVSDDEGRTSTNGLYTTDETGRIVLGKLQPQTYIAVEVSAPDGYQLDPTPQTVVVGTDDAQVLRFYDEPLATLTIIKRDVDTKELLAGAEFTVKDGAGNLIGEEKQYVTGEDGTVTLSGLVPNTTVVVSEDTPPQGYWNGSDLQTVMLRSGAVNSVTFENRKLGTLIIHKYVEGSNNQPLKGVAFRVTAGDGTEIGPDGGVYYTDAKGEIVIRDIQPDIIVKAREIKTVEGYLLDGTPQDIKIIGGKTQELTFWNAPVQSLTIQKYESGTTTPIAGVAFLVTDSSGAVVGTSNGEFLTDRNGRISITDLKPGTTVTAKEIRTVSGYVLDPTPQSILIKEGEAQVLTFYNQRKGGLIIEKVDSVTGEPLSGAEFLITTIDGQYVDDNEGQTSTRGVYRTDEHGRITLTKIQPGSYKIKETTPPAGYVLDSEEQTVRVNANDTQTIRFTNTALQSVVIQKFIEGTTTGLPGVTFLVTDANGAPVGSANGEHVTDSSGRIVLTGLVPGTVLTVREVKTVKGYVLNGTPQTIVVGTSSASGSAGTGNTLTFYDDPLSVLIIRKYVEGSTTPIPGTRFLVTDGRGAAVGNTDGEYTTDEHGEIILRDLEPGAVIHAKELRAADGFVNDGREKTITIQSGDVQELTFYNVPTGALIIVKKDSTTGELLQGAEFQITFANGEPVGNLGGAVTSNGIYTTDERGQITITGLQPCVLTVRETKAPANHVLDNQPRTVTVNAGDTQTLTVSNDPCGTLKIVKRDRATGALLKGAEFQITYADGSFVGNYGGTVTSNGMYTTDANGEIIIRGLMPSTIQILETRAPEGYLLDSTPVTVEVGANDTQTIDIFNDATQTLTIQKYVTGTTKPIAGVKFLITDSSGAVVGPNNGIYTTDSTGRIVLTGLTPGVTITAKELAAAEGFVLDSTPQSILIKSGEAQTLVFYNSADGGVELVKVDANDKTKRLGNATFEIRRMDQGVVTTVTTGKDGRATAKLDAGDYYAVEIEAPEGYKLDNTPHYFTVADGKTTTVTIKNKAYSGIEIHKIDAITGEGIYGVSFLLYDSKNNVVGQYTSDDRGYVRIMELDAGTYRLRELENPGYIVDTQLKTVEVRSGEVTLVEWKNSPITGQIQILKTSADYNSMNGWPAGTPIPNTIFEVYNRAGKLVDTIKTDKNGIAATKPLPLGRYKVIESKAADFYGLDKTPIEVEIEFAGQIVKAAMTNKSLYTNVSITKRGYVEVMPGQVIRYDFSNIANNSTTALQSFYWRDTLPTNAVRLEKIVTGTWNASGNYKIVYKTNMSGGDYRVLADSLATNRNYVLNASPAALGLGSGEYVTEFMAVFGVVPANFRQVEAPQVYCKVLDNVSGGTEFCNTADVGGLYNGQWIMAVDRWVTRVYKPSTPLPRTGY